MQLTIADCRALELALAVGRGAAGLTEIEEAASDFFERVGVADSIRPMNIKPEVWSGLGYDEEDFSKPEKNIEAAVKLIKGIQDRLDPKDRTPANIGSIYNFAGAEIVNDVGARIQRAYDEQLWKK